MRKRDVLKRLLYRYNPYKRTVIVTCMFTILAVVVDFIYPYIVQYAFDNVDAFSMKKLLILIGGLIGMYLFEVLRDYNTYYRFDSTLDRIQQKMQEDIFNKCMSLSYQYYDNHNIGDMISLLVHDVKLTRELLYALPCTLIQLVLRIVVGVFVFASLSLPLYLACIPVVTITAILMIKGGKQVDKSMTIYREKQSKMVSFFTDRLSGIRTIISFGNENKEKNHFHDHAKECRKVHHGKWRAYFTLDSGHTFITNWLWFVILVVGLILLHCDKITISTLLAFEVSAWLLSEPFSYMTKLFSELGEGLVGFERIVKVLDEKEDIVNTPYLLPLKIRGDIAFDHVSYQYTDEMVLDHMTMRVKAGEYLAIVGESGVGKSTIANLIPRYYDVTDGTILIDGEDIRMYHLQHLRKSVGVVSQDTFLFSDTVLENIRIAKPTATMEEVIDVAKKANADEFIRNLPNGYSSQVGERGVKLSGGQKQRIAIARCLLMKTPIIIFDEATSSLDNESEKEIQKTIENLKGTYTILVIAHRLTTIRNADRILVIDEGHVFESGTHDELMKSNLKYAELYKAWEEDTTM